MKFDCRKTLNFLREKRRMCDTKSDCEVCLGYNCIEGLDPEEAINVVQEWSNTHEYLEPLNKREFDFIISFVPFNSAYDGWDPDFYEIERRKEGDLWLRIVKAYEEPVVVPIDNHMFKFIDCGGMETMGYMLKHRVTKD